MRVLALFIAACVSAAEWQKYCVDTVCNRCRSYLVRTMDENAKHYRRCLAITINPECCQFETNLHFNNLRVFPKTESGCYPNEPDSTIKLVQITQRTICSESSMTVNLTEAAQGEAELEAFFADVEKGAESKFQEELAELQPPENEIIINKKKCQINFNTYNTCKEIRSDEPYSNTIDVGKYVVISLCSCAFGVLLVHFCKWSKSDSLRRQSNFVERQRSQVQSPSLAHSATLNSVDVRSAS